MKRESRPKPKPVPKIEAPEPVPPTSSRRWWIFALGGAIIVFAACTMVARQNRLDGWELAIFHWINDWPNSLRYGFLAATIVPESLWIAVASVMVTFLAKLYRLAWELSVAIFMGFGFAGVTTLFAGRPRPVDLVSNTHQRIHDTGVGFPSGHTMIITLLVLMLWPYLPRGWRWVVAALIPLMALSRIYLGVHAPLDVVGGFAIGVAVVSILNILPAKVRELLRFD